MSFFTVYISEINAFWCILEPTLMYYIHALFSSTLLFHVHAGRLSWSLKSKCHVTTAYHMMSFKLDSSIMLQSLFNTKRVFYCRVERGGFRREGAIKVHF